eukprot:COSAG06_NODE_67739_length_251_cov_0.677632_1_plen_73_part_10
MQWQPRGQPGIGPYPCLAEEGSLVVYRLALYSVRGRYLSIDHEQPFPRIEPRKQCSASQKLARTCTSTYALAS